VRRRSFGVLTHAIWLIGACRAAAVLSCAVRSLCASFCSNRRYLAPALVAACLVLSSLLLLAFFVCLLLCVFSYAVAVSLLCCYLSLILSCVARWSLSSALRVLCPAFWSLDVLACGVRLLAVYLYLYHISDTLRSLVGDASSCGSCAPWVRRRRVGGSGSCWRACLDAPLHCLPSSRSVSSVWFLGVWFVSLFWLSSSCPLPVRLRLRVGASSPCLLRCEDEVKRSSLWSVSSACVWRCFCFSLFRWRAAPRPLSPPCCFWSCLVWCSCLYTACLLSVCRGWAWCFISSYT